MAFKCQNWALNFERFCSFLPQNGATFNQNYKEETKHFFLENKMSFFTAEMTTNQIPFVCIVSGLK